MDGGANDAAVAAGAWLSAHAEEHVGGPAADLNQYWYSAATAGALIAAVREGLAIEHDAALDVAFVSTPSLFYSLPSYERVRSRVLDIDEALRDAEPGFVYYDFHHPTRLPEELRGAFHMCVIDPPYITLDVWRHYAATASWLLHDGGLVLCTTVVENAAFLKATFGTLPCTYLPSIPQLPYQYAAFANFAAPSLAVRNVEIPLDPADVLAAAAAATATTASDVAQPQPSDSAPNSREAPLRGAGPGAYDFEALLQAELARHGQHQQHP
jgi:EEF1A lysine methyltransferase 1